MPEAEENFPRSSNRKKVHMASRKPTLLPGAEQGTCSGCPGSSVLLAPPSLCKLAKSSTLPWGATVRKPWVLGWDGNLVSSFFFKPWEIWQDFVPTSTWQPLAGAAVLLPLPLLQRSSQAPYLSPLPSAYLTLCIYLRKHLYSTYYVPGTMLWAWQILTHGITSATLWKKLLLLYLFCRWGNWCG